MRALLSITPGGPETLEIRDLPSPAPGPGQLRVRVLACGINYPDVLTIEDRYQVRPPRPFSPGSEITGVVDALGDGVTGWAPGDRLIAILPHGGLAEEILLEAGHAIPLPSDRDAVEGAGLIFTYATALHALAARGQLKTGETLLVLGAAGGVGLAAVEIGKALGARVVAGVSSQAKADAVRAAGADTVFIYPRDPTDREAGKVLAELVKQAVGPDGADVIFDPVGGDYTQAALRAIAWEGRHLVIGFPAGIPNLPLNLTLLKSCDIRGVFWGAFAMRDPARNAAHIGRLMTWWAEGRIRPRIDATFSLEEGGEAIRRLATRSVVGKVVVRVSPADAA